MLNINYNKPYKLTKHGYSEKTTHPLIYELAQEYDDLGYMSTGVGKKLEEIFDDDYEILIHRTGYTRVTESILYDVFNNGLINNGDSMQGVGSFYTNERTKTLSQITDMMLMVGSVKTAHNYKGSDGVFIVKIPKSYVDRTTPGEVKPIYFANGSEQRLLPEYIYGYLPVNDGVVGELIENPNYKDNHNYKHNGLLFEPEVEHRGRAM